MNPEASGAGNDGARASDHAVRGGAASPPGAAKWWICALLFLATLLNYLDRQTLSVSATPIANEMGLNDADLGRLFFAFFIAYGVAQICIGGLLDRFSVRLAFPVAVVAWSMAGASAALSAGFVSLFLFRVLLGICESPNWPLALRVTSRVFPPSQRSFANGLFQCGTSVGALIAPPIIIFLTTMFNWRIAFVVVGAAGFIWAVLWLGWFFLFPEPRLDSEQPEAEAGAAAAVASSPSTLGEILRSRALWGLLIATCFLNPLQYFYTAWLPRYFDTYAGVEFGVELAKRLVVVYLALDAGLIGGGWVVSVLSRRSGVVQARRVVALFGAACMASAPLVSGLRNVDVITALLCVATLGLGCFMVNYLAFTSEVSAKKVSTAAGILGGAGSLAGAAFMVVVGETVMKSGGFGMAFALAGIMPLVALAGLWIASTPTSTTGRSGASS